MAWLQVCNQHELEVKWGWTHERETGERVIYIFQCLAKAGQGGIYMQQVHYMQGSNLNKIVTRNVQI